MSIVIAAYNESATIAEVVHAVHRLAIEKEVVVVDNGSTDRTYSILEGLRQLIPELKIVRNRHNVGKGHGLRLGMQAATGSIIAFQDADLELDPTDLARLIGVVARDEADVAFGSRFRRPRGMALSWNTVGNLGLSFAASIMLGRLVTDVETCYKVFRRDLLDANLLESERFEIEIEVAFKLLNRRRRLRYRELPIRYTPRSYEQGKKVRMRDGLHALSKMIRYRLS